MKLLFAVFTFLHLCLSPLTVRGANSLSTESSVTVQGDEISKTLFFCRDQWVELKPEEADNYDYECIEYLNTDANVLVEGRIRAGGENSYNVDATLIDRNGNVLLIVHYDIINVKNASAIGKYFDDNYFVAMPVTIAGEDSFQGQGNNESKSVLGASVLDLTGASISFEQGANSVGIEDEIIAQFTDLYGTVTSDVQIYITDDESFCGIQQTTTVSDIVAEFENPQKLVYWFHLSGLGTVEDNGRVRVNSSSPGVGKTSFNGGVENYFDHHLKDYAPQDFELYGFGSKTTHYVYNTLDQFSGTVISTEHSDDEVDPEEAEKPEYQCPNISDPTGDQTIYLAPSGFPVPLPNTGPNTFHIPRFGLANSSTTAGHFNAALVGFSIASGAYTGSYQARYCPGGRTSFCSYNLRGSKANESRYSIPDVESIPFSVALGVNETKPNSRLCSDKKIIVNILPGFTPIIDANEFGEGLLISSIGGFNDASNVGSFIGGSLPRPVVAYEIPYCTSTLSPESARRVIYLMFDPPGGPPEGAEGLKGWAFDMYNEGNQDNPTDPDPKLERIFATYDAGFEGSQNPPTSPQYYKFLCNGTWETFDPVGLQKKELDIYSALFFSLSDQTHNALDAVGMVPGLGEFADVINGVIFTLEGDELNAGISFASTIPFAGVAAGGGRITAKVVDNGEEVVGVLSKLVKVFRKADGTLSRVDFDKFLASSAVSNDLTPEQVKKLFAIFSKPAAGSVDDIAAWEKRLAGFFENSNGFEFDDLVKAWKTLDVPGYEGLLNDFDWIEKVALLRSKGAKIVSEGGELVIKDSSTPGKIFSRIQKSESGEIFQEFSDTDILDITIPNSSVEVIDELAELIVRRSDDGEEIAGRLVRLDNGKFGFVEFLDDLQVSDAVKAFIKRRGALRRGFGDAITSAQEAHHLLPIALLKRSGAPTPDLKGLFEKAISSGFDYNDIASNGMALSKYRKAANNGLHASHPGYTNRVASEIQRRIIDEGGLSAINPVRAKEILEEVASDLRTRIQLEVDAGGAGKRINMITDLF